MNSSSSQRRRRRRVASALLLLPATWLLLINGSDDESIIATLAAGTNSMLYKFVSTHSTRHFGQQESVRFRAFGVGAANNVIPSLQQQKRRLLGANYDGAFDYDTVSANGTCSDASNTGLDATETYADTTSTGECADLCDSSSIGCAAFHFDEDTFQCQLFDTVPSNTSTSSNDPGVCHTKRAPVFVSIPNTTFGYCAYQGYAHNGLCTNFTTGMPLQDLPEMQFIPDLHPNTPEACAAACFAENCTSFDYIAPQNVEGACYLHFEAPTDLSGTTDNTCYHLCQGGGGGLATSSLLTSAASAQGDPLITGLNNQAFLFEGRPSQWYANLAMKAASFQWNMLFEKYQSCPQGADTFITSSAITFPGLDPANDPSHSILLTVEANSNFMCTNPPCLGDGSLTIVFDERTHLTHPGDYNFHETGTRIVAHNTYASCSRRWYDYIPFDEEAGALENDEGAKYTSLDDSRRRLGALVPSSSKTPLDFIVEDKGEMIDHHDCQAWIAARQNEGNLFDQQGDWSSVHIDTPHVSFHVELRQNRQPEDTSNGASSPCQYASLDIWITKISPYLMESAGDWRGILGETREIKYDAEGNQIISDRMAILDYPEDEAYEVDGPFSKFFVAL